MESISKEFEVSSGISALSDKDVCAVVDKVIEKIVRVDISDGRQYIGILQCVDQQGTVYVQDALELINKTDATYMHHDLMTDHILKHNKDKQ